MVGSSETTTILLLLIGISTNLINAQTLVSPCPNVFQYEKGTDADRWYASATLQSDSDLNGIWLRFVLDRPSIQLGNWFGEVEHREDNGYLVKNRNYKLKANTPFKIRFFIKYNTNEPVPKITEIRLNAKTLCPEKGATTPPSINEGVLSTSSLLEEATTQRPSNNGGGDATFVRPGLINQQANNNPDEDFFQGDLSIFSHGIPRPSGGEPGSALEVACGTVVKSPRPLITYGMPTTEGEFPWHVALYHARGIDLTYICGANLISTTHLLTVAHCVTRVKSNKPLSVDSLVVYMGKHYLKRWSNPGIQDKRIESIIVHPDYNPHTFSSDIAVMRLNSPVKITNYVRPVCLWEDDVRLETVVSKVGTVVGWGFDENGRVTEQLTQAKMPVVSQETCIYSFPDFFSRFTSKTSFCAGFLNGTSVCNGDSGGGMVFAKSSSATSESPIWQLRGLVSISVALQNQLKCDSLHYVVFTDVAKFVGWIRASLI